MDDRGSDRFFKSRIFRCGASNYYTDEILLANDTHTEGRLEKIREAGFNGIWLHAQLRDLEPGDLFKGYSDRIDERLAALTKLIGRAKRHGLGVWLYFTEPLGLNSEDPFWKTHPEVKGHFHPRQWVNPPGAYALCSSTPEVKRYLREGFFDLFRKTPLAGAILITSSEHDNNCWSNVTEQNNECNCPRCGPRGPAEVIAEVITLIHDGIRDARPDARVVAWDWDWHRLVKPPFTDITERLPAEVVIMGDFERGGRIRRLNKRRIVDEYSLVYPGPSNKFRKEADYLSGKRPLWAKLQINTTHELATVPSMPMVVSLYRKFRYLREVKAAGYMATWNFACNPDTLNTHAVKKLSSGERIPDEKAFLKRLAEEYFGTGIRTDEVVEAWYGFYRAGLSYPLDGFGFLYCSPINFSMAYPLKLDFEGSPMPPAWTRDFSKFGDKLEDTLSGYSLKEVVELLGRLSRQWRRASALYLSAIQDGGNTANVRKESENAIIIGCCFESLYNTYRWYAWRKNKSSRNPLTSRERRLLEDEAALITKALPVLGGNPEFGFHGEHHLTMFDTKSVTAKLRDLERMLKRAGRN